MSCLCLMNDVGAVMSGVTESGFCAVSNKTLIHLVQDQNIT